MRYRIVVLGMRHSPEYRSLSRAAPNGRTLYEWMVAGDCTTIIPGLFYAGWRSIMEQLGWDNEPEAEQRRVWAEVIASGLVRYDPDTRLVWLPDLVATDYLPDQPNVLKSWRIAWAELPDCDLKHEAWESLREALYKRRPRRIDKEDREEDGSAPTTVYGRLFDECCPEPRCARAQARLEAQKQAQVEPQSEAQAQGHVRGSGAGSAATSGRGSLSGTGSGRRSETGSGPDDPRSARARSPAAPPPPVDSQRGIFDRFEERAGKALGIQKRNAVGICGMPQKASDLFREKWKEARDSGWTEDELLHVADWLKANGLGWLSTPAYDYVAGKLIEVLTSAKQWHDDKRPPMDKRGRRIEQKTSRSAMSGSADDEQRQM